MPRYNYICKKCGDKANAVHGVKDIFDLPTEVLESEVLFETSHSMEPTSEELEEAAKCPRCDSVDCVKTAHGNNIHSYIRGYGWLDKAGAKRDMNKYTLMTDDPYAEHRMPGEVDHIKVELEKQGRHDPKSKHFSTARSNDLTEEVKKATGS
jgi:hypothetical protein